MEDSNSSIDIFQTITKQFNTDDGDNFLPCMSDIEEEEKLNDSQSSNPKIFRDVTHRHNQ